MFLCHDCDIDSSLSWLRGTVVCRIGMISQADTVWKKGLTTGPCKGLHVTMALAVSFHHLSRTTSGTGWAGTFTNMDAGNDDWCPHEPRSFTCAVASAGHNSLTTCDPATSSVHYVVKSWLAPVCRLFPLSHRTCFLGCQKRGLSWGISLGVVSPSNSAQQLMWAVRCIENIVWHFFTASATN